MPATAKAPIAYFSLEFGIDSNVPTYAGGLGILAADTLLQAADDNVPIVGIGMMYKGKRFIQKIDETGMQYEEATPFRLDGSSCFRRVEILGKPIRFDITVGDEKVWVEAYKERLGDMATLFLLTTDVEGNSDYWRNLFDEIYWGNDEEQIRERVVFGIGGMKLLSILKIKPSVVHIQEGRPSFAVLPALAEIMSKMPEITFEDAYTQTRSKVVYTNHTLVASGIHSYDKGLIEKYLYPLCQEMNLPHDKVVALGVEEDGRFHTTRFALNWSRTVSSVSAPHMKEAKKRYPEYNWVNVTNGVYLGRWQRPEFRNTSLSPQELWEVHKQKKYSLMREVQARIGIGYDPNWCIISWSRRVSGYKQLPALFADINRLASILNKTNTPALLLIAGKAHPGDTAAKELIRDIIGHMKNKLAGHALFVHNYDIALAEELVAGSDVWLNTPEFGREACGTSGMKAISNGVLNLTVADGWAGEVKWDNTGWVLDHTSLTESIYTQLENTILPLHYERDDNGVPQKWIEMMKNSINLSQKYSAARMLAEYQKKLYG